MDVITKFLNKVSYKFDKGYPDMNNDQDVLLLETLLSEIEFPVDLNEVSEEDSPNLPDDILQLKDDIKSIVDSISNVRDGGTKSSFNFYVKGIGDRDREERRSIAQKITQNLPKGYTIGDNNFTKTDEGPYFYVTIGDKKYRIFVKGLGKSPFDTDTDQKEGLVIFMYNILNAGENLKPFNKENLESNVEILNKSIDSSSLTEGIDNKALGAIKSLLTALNNSDLDKFPVNKFKNFNNPYSIALKINQDYSGEKIIRDGAFNEARAMGQQLCKIPADKWNPGDIYIEINPPGEMPNSLESLNGLFVNDWGSKDSDLVSISLKESSSQPGRAKSYFKNFTTLDGNLRDQEYNLTKDELEWDLDTLQQNVKVQQDKFVKLVQGKGIKLSGDGWDKLLDDEKQLKATYGSFKLINFLLDNSERTNPRDAILDLVSYGLSLSGVNPTFFKLRGTNDGSAANDPVKFPAGSTTSLNEDPEIINSSKAGGFLLKTVINTVQGGEITDTKKYSHRFRTSGGDQISIV